MTDLNLCINGRPPANEKQLACGALYPNVAKAGGLQSQEEHFNKINLEASSRKAGASEGEVVVLYFEPSATRNLKSSGFPRCFKGKQHGKIDPILRILRWRYPGICHFAIILTIITNYYLIFDMFFMQLRGLHGQLIDKLPSTTYKTFFNLIFFIRRRKNHGRQHSGNVCEG